MSCFNMILIKRNGKKKLQTDAFLKWTCLKMRRLFWLSEEKVREKREREREREREKESLGVEKKKKVEDCQKHIYTSMVI